MLSPKSVTDLNTVVRNIIDRINNYPTSYKTIMSWGLITPASVMEWLKQYIIIAINNKMSYTGANTANAYDDFFMQQIISDLLMDDTNKERDSIIVVLHNLYKLYTENSDYEYILKPWLYIEETKVDEQKAISAPQVIDSVPIISTPSTVIESGSNNTMLYALVGAGLIALLILRK